MLDTPAASPARVRELCGLDEPRRAPVDELGLVVDRMRLLVDELAVAVERVRR